MGSLRRLASVPGLVVATWLLFLLPPLLLGIFVKRSVSSSLRPYTVEGEPFLRSFFEMLFESGSLVPGVVFWAVAFAVLTRVVWVVLLGGIVLHLEHPTSTARLVSDGIRKLPHVLAVGIWHWLLRLLCIAVPAVLAFRVLEGTAAALAAVIVLVIWLWSVCSLDLARTRVVLEPVHPLRPRAAWRGFHEALARPAVLFLSALLTLGQWALVVAIPYSALVGLGEDPGPWLLRGFVALGCVLALLRLALAVEAVAGPSGRRFSS